MEDVMGWGHACAIRAGRAVTVRKLSVLSTLMVKTAKPIACEILHLATTAGALVTGRVNAYLMFLSVLCAMSVQTVGLGQIAPQGLVHGIQAALDMVDAKDMADAPASEDGWGLHVICVFQDTSEAIVIKCAQMQTIAQAMAGVGVMVNACVTQDSMVELAVLAPKPSETTDRQMQHVMNRAQHLQLVLALEHACQIRSPSISLPPVPAFLHLIAAEFETNWLETSRIGKRYAIAAMETANLSFQRHRCVAMFPLKMSA